jgi:hypothetical protein
VENIMFEFNRDWSRVSYKWLISAQAACLFGFASVMVCALTVFAVFYDDTKQIPHYGPIAQFFWALLGVTISISIFFLMSGMQQFRNARELRDPVGAKKTKLGSMALWIGMFYAAVVYYLLVYLPARQIALRMEGSGTHVS